MNPQTEAQKILIERQKKDLEEGYNKRVETLHTDLAKTHDKREFTFTIEEKRRILQQKTIMAFANQAINDIVNSTVLPRLPVDRTPKMEVLFEAELGKLTLWTLKSDEEPKAEEPLPSE